MKKLIAFMLALFMLSAVVLLASCGNTTEPSGSSATTASTEATSGKNNVPADPTNPADNDNNTSANTSSEQEQTTASETTPTDPDNTTSGGASSEESTTSTPESTTSGGGDSPSNPGNYGDGYSKPDGYLDVDFGGFTVRFVTTWDDADSGDAHPYRWCTKNEVAVDTRSGTNINMAVYDRNAVMKELYNVNIVVAQEGSAGDLIANDVKSGTNEYDFGFSQYGLYAGNTNGYYVNAYDLDLDFNLPGWNTTYFNEVTVKDANNNNKLYLLDGDFNLSAYRAIWSIVCNVDLYNQNFSESIFDIVNKGEWTVDKMMEMIATVRKDNGDSVWTPGTDTFGLLYYTYLPEGLVMSLGLKFVDANNGVFTTSADIITANNAAERIAKAAELINMEGAKFYGYGDDQIPTEMRSGRSLFISEVFDEVERLSDSTTLNYTPLPLPLYEPDASCNYRLYVNTKASYLTVSANAFGSNKKMMSDFLNMYTFHSNKIVYSEFINSYGKLYCQDAHAIDMVNYIVNGRHYDFGCYSSTINGYGTMSDLINNNNASAFSGKVAKLVRNGNNAITTLVNTMTDSK